MKTEIFSHYNGEFVVDKKIKENLLKVIEETSFTVTPGCGEDLRTAIMDQLKKSGWSDEFKLAADSSITITSSISDHILCFQTGNMGRFYADLLKMEYVFQNKKAKAAIYLIPSKAAAKIIGSNIAHFDRFVFEVSLFRKIISIPILVIGIK